MGLFSGISHTLGHAVSNAGSSLSHVASGAVHSVEHTAVSVAHKAEAIVLKPIIQTGTAAVNAAAAVEKKAEGVISTVYSDVKSVPAFAAQFAQKTESDIAGILNNPFFLIGTAAVAFMVLKNK